jgi:hypothetical protein
MNSPERSNGTPPTDRRRPLAIALVAVVGVVIIGLVVWGFVAHVTGSNQASPPTPSALPSTPFVASTPTALPTATAGPTTSGPVAFTSSVAVKKGVVVRVAKIESVSGKASIPGEVAGPSIRFTVTVSNGTDAPIGLDTVAVNSYYGSSKTPAISLSSPGGKPFAGTLSSGSSATGVYVFNIPKSSRTHVELTVDFSVNTVLAVYSGPVP